MAGEARNTSMRQRHSPSWRRRVHPAALVVVTLALLAGSRRASAQDNYEIQVYGSDLVPKGETMVELHSNFTVEGSTTSTDGLTPTRHALHETLEITHGFTDFMEVGFYVFTSTTPGYGAQWVGDHIRPRIAVPESWHWPVGASLSTEIGYQRRAFSTDTWTWEIRPILDQRLGRFYWAVNPALERSLQGASTSAGIEFSPNVELTYDVTKKVQAALEYYGAFGSVQHFDPMMQTEQQIFPAVNLDFGPDWEFNFGVGPGLTKNTDHMLVKMILGRRLGRPGARGAGQ